MERIFWKLMVNNYRKEKYVFRLYAVRESDVVKFKEKFSAYDYKITDLSKVPFRKVPGKFTIILDLTKKKKFIKLANKITLFIRDQKISKKSYGIRASLVTSSDTDQLEVPDHVMSFYKIVGGCNDFSFTCI